MLAAPWAVKIRTIVYKMGTVLAAPGGQNQNLLFSEQYKKWPPCYQRYGRPESEPFKHRIVLEMANMLAVPGGQNQNLLYTEQYKNKLQVSSARPPESEPFVHRIVLEMVNIAMWQFWRSFHLC